MPPLNIPESERVAGGVEEVIKSGGDDLQKAVGKDAVVSEKDAVEVEAQMCMCSIISQKAGVRIDMGDVNNNTPEKFLATLHAKSLANPEILNDSDTKDVYDLLKTAYPEKAATLPGIATERDAGVPVHTGTTPAATTEEKASHITDGFPPKDRAILEAIMSETTPKKVTPQIDAASPTAAAPKLPTTTPPSMGR